MASVEDGIPGEALAAALPRLLARITLRRLASPYRLLHSRVVPQ